MAQDLKRVYYHIIDDVVAKMKPEFVQEGVDESVLNAIRQRWAQKLTERGIISEADGQEDVAKKEEGDKASTAPTRKRPHDGSGPSTKQEANFDSNPPVQPAPALQGMPRQPQQQPQPLPAGLTPQLLQGLQQQQQHAGGIQQAAAGLAQVLAQAQSMPGGIQAAMGALPRLQQQAGLQALMQQRNVQLQGLPQHQQQQLQGLQNLHNLQAAMQLQGMPRMPGAVQVPGVAAAMPGVPAMGGVAGMPQMQIPLQQHAAQQQQMPRIQMMAGIPRMQGLMQQQPQQQQQRPGGYIPQQDGSSDMPPSIAEMAQAAGISQEQLRALMPKRIVATLDARNRARSSSSTSRMHATQAAAAVGLQVGSSSSWTARAGTASRHVKQQRRIPQVDGNGDDDDDDDDDEEDYVGDGVEEDGVEDGADDAEDGEEAAEDEDEDADAEDIAKLDDDLDAQEEADKEDIENVGFALYEKVHRAKNRWRCNLRYGVFFINGKEYMFNKGNTDLTF